MMEAHPHENIVQFYDSYLVNNTLWVVMEYLEGRALTRLLQRKRWVHFRLLGEGFEHS